MYFPYLQNLRRAFHKIPELGFHEVSTAAFIQKELRRLKIPFEKGIAKTGIVAVIHGTASGSKKMIPPRHSNILENVRMSWSRSPTVMFRADMDGLAIEEKNNLPYRSRHTGVMHACGHDGHMAVLLGLARLLKEKQSKLRGTAVLVFQPAEEGGAGAKKMVEAGVVKKYKPDSFFSFHLANDKPVGTVRARAGLQQAGALRFMVTFNGPGGHAAYLSTTQDVIKAAREFCGTLENLGREVFSWDRAPIVHVGMLHAGTAANAVAHEAVIKGTMRVQGKQDFGILRRAITHRAKHIAQLYGLPIPHCEFGTEYIPLVNDADATRLVQKVARQEHYAFQTLSVHAGADDAAFFLDKIPGCHFKVSAKKPGSSTHHSPGFNFDERGMEVALNMFLGLAKELMI